MKALIVGGSCLLGRYLLATAPRGWQAVATWHTLFTPDCALQLDVTSKSQVAYVVGRIKPDVILMLASVGDVDWCETNCALAREINVGGAENVRDEADRLGVPLVYFSSNAVFDGAHPPYSETSERRPVNRYGATRRDAEDLVMRGRNWLILRLFLLYGWPPLGARGNWAETVACRLRAGEAVRLVDDTYWQPSYALDVALRVWEAVGLARSGALKNETLHLAPAGKLTLYEFGRLVADAFMGGKAADCRIEPISSAGLKIAPRPVDSSYNVGKAERLGLRLRDPVAGLACMQLEELLGVEEIARMLVADPTAIKEAA